MRILATCLIAGMALAPFAAFGQSADAKYCQSLADLYRKTNKENLDATVPEAINQCNKGNTAGGIPVLEKALTDAKVTLSAQLTSPGGERDSLADGQRDRIACRAIGPRAV
jgi:hypothetical protein